MLSMCRNKSHQGERLMGFGSVYLMVLSTWNSEYALQWQCTKTIRFCYVRHPMHLLVLFAIPKSIFHPSGPFRLIKTVLKSLHVLLGLFPVWNFYPKVCHKKGTT